MALALENRNAWVFSPYPYCFCDDRYWITVSDVNKYTNVVDVAVPGVVGGDDDTDAATTIPGLSDDDTALLAALLTALALFLFFLFLLLCLLCPWGLCCGKKSFCCKKGAKKEKKVKAVAASVGSNDSVNLTAVGMPIPRAWMDENTGFSDSELEKRQKLDGKEEGSRWQNKDGDHWMSSFGHADDFGLNNGIYNRGFASEVKDGGWFSTQDLDSVYGSVRANNWRRKGSDVEWPTVDTSSKEFEKIRLEEFYRGGMKGHRRNDSQAFQISDKFDNESSRDGTIDKIMTVASSNEKSFYSNTNGNHCNSVHQDGGQKNMQGALVGPAMNSVTEISLTNEREEDIRNNQSESAVLGELTTSLTSYNETDEIVDDKGALLMKRDTKSETETKERSSFGYTELKAYTRKVVEETTTTSTE